MEIVKVQKVDFTIAGGDSGGTGTLSGFTDLTKMVVFATWNAGDHADPGEDLLCLDVYISNTTTVNADRVASHAGITNEVSAYVIQFGSDTTVYKGTYALATTDLDDTQSLGGTATLANTFGWGFHKRADASGFNAEVRYSSIENAFPSTTQISFTRDQQDGVAIDGHWFAVESSTLTVEHGNWTEAATANTSETDTITTVDLGDTFCLMSFSNNKGQYNDEGMWTADLNTTTSIRVRRGYGDAANCSWTYQIITDSNAAVQRGDFTYATTTGYATLSPTVDLTKSWPKLSTQGWICTSDVWNSETGNRRCHQVWLSANNQIDGETQEAITDLILPWEVVEISGAAAATRRVFVVS